MPAIPNHCQWNQGSQESWKEVIIRRPKRSLCYKAHRFWMCPNQQRREIRRKQSGGDWRPRQAIDMGVLYHVKACLRPKELPETSWKGQCFQAHIDSKDQHHHAANSWHRVDPLGWIHTQRYQALEPHVRHGRPKFHEGYTHRLRVCQEVHWQQDKEAYRSTKSWKFLRKHYIQ